MGKGADRSFEVQMTLDPVFGVQGHLHLKRHQYDTNLIIKVA